jgi:hypothetical protein
MDFTGSECGIDAQTGLTGFAPVSAPIGDNLTAGLELTFADAVFVNNDPEDRLTTVGHDGPEVAVSPSPSSPYQVVQTRPPAFSWASRSVRGSDLRTA